MCLLGLHGAISLGDASVSVTSQVDSLSSGRTDSQIASDTLPRDSDHVVIRDVLV